MKVHKRKIILIVGSVVLVFVVAAIVATALYLLTDTHKQVIPPSTQPSTNNSETGKIPATKKEQNDTADAAFQAALTAANRGDITEAKKQLSIAETLYKAAENEKGIENVRGLYGVVNTTPEASKTPTEGTTEK